MSYQNEILTMTDSNQNVFHSWIPDGDVKACVVLSHGMTEYAFRYDNFAKFLNSHGYAFYAEDHRGHGETAALAEKNGKKPAFGYLSDKNGFFKVVEDIHTEVETVKSRNPGKRVFLMAHSFGSFVGQCFLETYGQEVDGVILMGTRGPSPDEGISKMAASFFCLFGTKKRPSKFMDNVSFGSYNKNIPNLRTKFDWLTKDQQIVDDYISHPWCGFVCTGGFFKDLASSLVYIHKKSNIAKIPIDTPVYLMAGKDDPVGHYGKSVQKLHDLYKSHGIKDLGIRLYENDRHELLNETDRDTVYNDVLVWLNARCK